MKYIFLVISFILEGYVSNFINIDTILFNNCFTLTALFIISRHFKNPKKYYLISFITGLIYDIVYTDKILINAYLFSLISYLIVKTDKRFKDGILLYILKLVIAIIIYRILTFLIFALIEGTSFDALKLLISISSSLILNIIYLIFILVLQEKSGRKILLNRCSEYI